jgi:hypothetical protein
MLDRTCELAREVSHCEGLPMNAIITILVLSVALALLGPASFAQTGTQDRSAAPQAISAELARKCRALAIQAHPTQQPGSRYGSAQAQREYFQQCVAKGGNIEN